MGHTTALRELATDRGLVGGPFGSSLGQKDYVTDGIPVIRGTNLNLGRYLGGDFEYVSEDKVSKDLARNTAKPGDLVFTQRGTLGQVALVPQNQHSDYVISQSQMRLRVDTRLANPTFVYYACTDSSFTRQVDDRAIRTGVPHINLGILGDLQVPLPSIEVQDAIAEILGALDDKIGANTRSTFVVDGLSNTMVANAVEVSARKRLGEIAELTMGSSPKGSTLNESGMGTVFYQGIRDFGLRYPSNRVWTSDPIRLAAPLDTLLSVRAPVGQANLATEATCIGRGIAAVRSRHETPYTLFHELRLASDSWTPFNSEGTVFGSISKHQLTTIELSIVPPERRSQLELQLVPLEGLLENLLAENTSLASTRDALLPQLMSGKLKVKDAEKVIEGVL